jgi:hypothetical protein
MIFSSEIQTSAYDGKGYHKNSSEAKKEKDKSKGNLHRNKIRGVPIFSANAM